MHGLEAVWADQINFAYLDIDDPNTAPFKQQLGFRYQPHLFLVDGNGTVVQQWVGFVTEEELAAAFEQLTPQAD